GQPGARAFAAAADLPDPPKGAPAPVRLAGRPQALDREVGAPDVEGEADLLEGAADPVKGRRPLDAEARSIGRADRRDGGFHARVRRDPAVRLAVVRRPDPARAEGLPGGGRVQR